jgi:uncharacterized SAM-binding protein YcdF (DUF218 family)
MWYLFFKALVLPPGLFVVAGIFCMLFYRHRPKLVFSLLCTSTLLLYAMSSLYVGKNAIAMLEPKHALRKSDISAFKPQAIVVLGADRINAAPEYGYQDSAGGNLLIRLRYAAHLYRQTKLPVLVSGGRGYDDRLPQADVMAGILQQDFKVPVNWREGQSLTTWENAGYSRDILQRAGVNRVLLVTQAFHMKRSVESLRQFGFDVLPAPTHFLGLFERPITIKDFYPSATAFQLSSFALHEYIGLLYYQLRYFAASDLNAPD